MSLSKLDFEELCKAFAVADMEQIVVMQKYLESVVSQRINNAAFAFGLVEQPTAQDLINEEETKDEDETPAEKPIETPVPKPAYQAPKGKGKK